MITVDTARETYALAKIIYAELIANADLMDDDPCFESLVLNAKHAARRFVESYETIDDDVCEG